MQDIADEAGVNQALLHYYFRSKDRLATAVFLRAANRLVPAVLGIFAAADPLEVKIERFVHTYIDTVRQNPFIPAYLFAEVHHHPERLLEAVADRLGGAPAVHVRPVLDRLQEQIDAEVAAGRFRPVPALHLLASTIALCVFPFLARPILHFAAGMDDAAFERFLDERRAEIPRFILGGLRA